MSGIRTAACKSCFCHCHKLSMFISKIFVLFQAASLNFQTTPLLYHPRDPYHTYRTRLHPHIHRRDNGFHTLLLKPPHSPVRTDKENCVPLFISEIFYCIFIYALICFCITKRSAPPEPAARCLMKRSKHYRSSTRPAKSAIISRYALKYFIIFSSRKNLVHCISGQCVRRIYRKIIFCIGRICLRIIIGFSFTREKLVYERTVVMTDPLAML